jgi:hypothetical protein
MARAAVKNIRTARGKDREWCMVSSGDGWMIFVRSDGVRYRDVGSRCVSDHFFAMEMKWK